MFLAKNLIATLILSHQFVTVLTFPESISTFTSGSNKLDLFFKLSADRKTLILKPLRSSIDTNLVVITPNGNFNFNIVTGPNPHKFVEIKRGGVDSHYKIIKKTKNFTALEGATTLKLIQNGKSSMHAKGSPIFINGKREIY